MTIKLYAGWRETVGSALVCFGEFTDERAAELSKDGGTERLIQEVISGGQRLPPRNDVRNHSPAGFEWGYGGSGPAQLALALCIDATGDVARAERVYQDFKFAVIGHIQTDTWILSNAQIERGIQAVEARRRADDPISRRGNDAESL